MTATFIISGPGGAGKGTIVERLIERDRGLWLSRSWTTRERRGGEDPSAYVFVSDDEFMARVEAGGFLEWVTFLDYKQGSPVPEPREGSDVVFEIDIEGAAAILEVVPDALSIFIDCPDLDVQRDRLVGRGDPPDAVDRRLAKGIEERIRAADLGSTVVVNDDLDTAVGDVESLISRRRLGG